MRNTSGHIYTFDQIQAFVAGALPEPQAREIGAHIAACAECRATANQLRSLDSLTAQAVGHVAPDGYFETFGSRVASRIAARKLAPARKGFHMPIWGFVPLAAAAGLVLVLVLRPEPPAPHLAIRLPPATRLGAVAPAAPAAQTSHAPTVTTAPEMERPGKKESPSSAGPGLAVNSQAPATMPIDQDRAARTEEAARTEAMAGKDKSSSSPARRNEQKGETTASDEPALAAKLASPAAELQDKQAVSPSPAAPGTAATPVIAVVPSGATVGLRGDKDQTPDRAGAIRDQRSRTSEGIPARVIVIHLPDGSTYCPEPEIATAIEIRLPPGRSTLY